MSRRDVKFAVSAFYVNDRRDFSTFKITKLQYNARYGWGENGHIHVNKFRLAQIKEFVSMVSTLPDLSEAQKTHEFSLDNIHVGALGALPEQHEGRRPHRRASIYPRADIRTSTSSRRSAPR